MKKYCIDCGKQLGKRADYYKTERCKSCAAKERTKISENNPHFKDGESIKKHYCKKCSKEISYVSYKFGKGFCCSCWQLGENNNSYKLESEKIKYYCIDCKKELKNYKAQRCPKCWYKLLHKDDCECCSCKAHKGEYKGKNHPNYIHGEGNFPYPIEFNDQLKELIRKRDNYTCQNCNIVEEEHLIVIGTVLTIHHIDYNKDNCLKDNLITLCNQCNIRANFNRDYWQELYQNKIAQTNKEALKNEHFSPSF